MKKINDRLNNRPTFKGQVFTRDSLTIPGQALTPQEIMKRFVTGVPQMKEVFTDENLDQFKKMDIFEQTDHLEALKKRNLEQKDFIDKKVKEINKRKADDEKKAEREKVKQELQAEMQMRTTKTENKDE